MKTIDDALNLRNHMLLRFQDAARSISISDMWDWPPLS